MAANSRLEREEEGRYGQEKEVRCRRREGKQFVVSLHRPEKPVRGQE